MSSCGLADLRLRIVARPTRAPRVERSLDSPLHLPVRPRLILPHPWFCRYEHSCATASTTKGAVKRNGTRHERAATPREAQSSATAHGVRGRRRRGRRSRVQRHMWHKSAATPREVRARLGPATAHGMGKLVAKVGYSGRHGRTPWHIALTLADCGAKTKGHRRGCRHMEGDGLSYGVCKV
jgi:hypothetical protein